MSSNTFFLVVSGEQARRRAADGLRRSSSRVRLRASLPRAASLPRLQRRQQLDEHRDDRRIERLARFLLQQADRGVEAHRLVIRPLRRQRVEVVDDREDARAERNLLALQPVRIALAVPALVVAEDERRDRIRERHAR